MYEGDKLREYIIKSEIRIFSNNIKVKLSKELAKKYDKGIYNNYLKKQDKYFELIKSLGIKYPGNSNPEFYIYIVPDDNYVELLRVPKIFNDGRGCGKPVKCFELDGFNYAYGISDGLIENSQENDTKISKLENEVHELSHIIQGQFILGSQLLGEGIAEALTLYALDYESLYEEHQNMIISLKKEEILTAEELLQQEREGTFGVKAILPNKTCSFRYSYISSYLFVRGCIETIVKTFDLSKIEAIQYFLEVIHQSSCQEEYLIFDIADALGISRDELLNGKQMQLNVIENITYNKNKML